MGFGKGTQGLDSWASYPNAKQVLIEHPSCPEALPDHARPAQGPSLPSGPLPARLSYHLVRVQFSHWHFILCDTSLLPMELLRVQSVPFPTRTSS